MQMENKKRMPQQAPQAKADKAPAEQDTALVWGKNPVTELLKSEAGVDTLLLADSMEPRMAGYYTALGKAAGAVIKRVPAGKLQKLCGTQDHQGVAAWAARIQYVGVEELLQIAKDRGEPPFLVLCDGIEDPHNLGAILRSALLCGAHGVIIPRRGSGTEAGRRAGAAGPGLFFLAARILGRSPSRSSSTAVENRSSVLKLLPLPSVISGRSSFWMGPNAEPPPEDSSMLPWPRLCRMASTWRSVTLSRMPRSACSWLSSSRMRSTESFVRLLGMLFSPLVWDSFFCAAVTCGAA